MHLSLCASVLKITFSQNSKFSMIYGLAKEPSRKAFIHRKEKLKMRSIQFWLKKRRKKHFLFLFCFVYTQLFFDKWQKQQLFWSFCEKGKESFWVHDIWQMATIWQIFSLEKKTFGILRKFRFGNLLKMYLVKLAWQILSSIRSRNESD